MGGGDAEMVIYIIDDLHNISVFDDIITSTINIITNSTLLMFLYNTIQIIASFEIKNTLQKNYIGYIYSNIKISDTFIDNEFKMKGLNLTLSGAMRSNS